MCWRLKLEGQVFCFMRDFKAYQEALGRPFPVAPGALVDELTAWQRNKTCAAAQGC